MYRRTSHYLFPLSLLIVGVDLVLKSEALVIYNAGVSFGLASSTKLTLLWLLIYLSLTIFVLWQRAQGQHQLFLEALVILGVSNTWDRIFYGAVRDYIFLAGIAFNLSDLFITLLLVYFGGQIIIQHNESQAVSDKNRDSQLHQRHSAASRRKK